MSSQLCKIWQSQNNYSSKKRDGEKDLLIAYSSSFELALAMMKWPVSGLAPPKFMVISSSSDSSFILSSSSFSSSGGAEFCLFCLKRKEMREKDFLVETLKSFLLFAFFAWYLVPRIPFFLLSSPLSSLLLHLRYLQSKKCYGVSTLFSLRFFCMNMFQCAGTPWRWAASPVFPWFFWFLPIS